MNNPPDWEERCALALSEIERDDASDKQKLERVRRILSGEAEGEIERAHVWVEVGMVAIPGTASSSPGNTINYQCRKCGARGYRVVFPTSVTLYPIVSDSANCTP